MTPSSILVPALMALALVLAACAGAGSGPSVSFAPTATPVVTAEPTPTDEPTVAPTPEPTAAVPTPMPPAIWTGLTWSDPATPSSVIHLYDLVAWGDSYVAGGTVGEGSTRAAFLTSPDGLEWTVVYSSVYRTDPGINRWPRHLVAFGGRLFAFSHGASTESQLIAYDGPIVWSPTSPDGSTWGRVETTGWNDAWTGAAASAPNTWILEQQPIEVGLVDVASGTAGILAIGNSFAADGNGMAPVLLHSSDGLAWAEVALPPASASALVNSVVEHDGRFVITGAVGVGPDPTAAMPAAWYSDDGVTWVQASIEPDDSGPMAGTEFGPLWAGADGLLTCRGNRELVAGGWRYMIEWLSADGSSWGIAPNLDQNPGCDWSASDGTRIVSLGPRDHASPTAWPGVTAASLSTDGSQWRAVELDSTLTDRLERFWVVPDGVIYAGEQSFWFGTAQVAE